MSTVPFARVYSFKYLGLILSCNLSWSSHINSVIKRAKRLVGLIYRQFYSLSSSQTLLSLYTTIVCPILEYGSAIWDPPSVSVSSSVESVQYFALKMVRKSWSAPYADLLSSLNLSSLQHRRLQSKLLLFYKINNGFLHSTLPPPPRPRSPPMSLRHFSPFDFSVPFCRTSTYYHSFLPSSIRLWNSLPSSVKKSQSISYIQFFLSCKLWFICFLYLTSFSFLISISYLKKKKKTIWCLKCGWAASLPSHPQWMPVSAKSAKSLKLKVAPPTKIGLHALHANLYLHEFF